MPVHIMLHTDGAGICMPAWRASCPPAAHHDSEAPASDIVLSCAALLQGWYAGLSALAAHSAADSCQRLLLTR